MAGTFQDKLAGVLSRRSELTLGEMASALRPEWTKPLAVKMAEAYAAGDAGALAELGTKNGIEGGQLLDGYLIDAAGKPDVAFVADLLENGANAGATGARTGGNALHVLVGTLSRTPPSNLTGDHIRGIAALGVDASATNNAGDQPLDIAGRINPQGQEALELEDRITAVRESLARAMAPSEDELLAMPVGDRKAALREAFTETHPRYSEVDWGTGKEPYLQERHTLRTMYAIDIAAGYGLARVVDDFLKTEPGLLEKSRPESPCPAQGAFCAAAAAGSVETVQVFIDHDIDVAGPRDMVACDALIAAGSRNPRVDLSNTRGEFYRGAQQQNVSPEALEVMNRIVRHAETKHRGDPEALLELLTTDRTQPTPDGRLGQVQSTTPEDCCVHWKLKGAITDAIGRARLAVRQQEGPAQDATARVADRGTRPTGRV